MLLLIEIDKHKLQLITNNLNGITMKGKNNGAVEITPAEEVIANVAANATENAETGAEGITEAGDMGTVSYADKVKSLIVAGGKVIRNAVIKNVQVSEEDNYNRVTFVLRSGIPAKVSPDNGLTFTDGLSTNLFSSTYAIAGGLKEDEELSFLANYIIASPKLINLIFNGGTIDIVQMTYPANTPIVNPFSTKEDNARIYDHEVIINYITKFRPGKVGMKMIDKLTDKIMESSINDII